MKNLKRKRKIKKATVKVVGSYNMLKDIIDFEEICSLEDSYYIIRRKWDRLKRKEKDTYEFSVFLGKECIYNFYNGKTYVHSNYKDIITFENLL